MEPFRFQACITPYQHINDLTFHGRNQTSLNLPPFYSSRFNFSPSCNTHYPCLACQSPPNDTLNFRPISMPNIPESKPLWYPTSPLESCSSLCESGVYRFLSSPSQASLPPSPAAPPFLGSTSLLSTYASIKAPTMTYPDSSFSGPSTSTSHPLTVRVKSEPLSFSSAIATPELSPDNFIKYENDCKSIELPKTKSSDIPVNLNLTMSEREPYDSRSYIYDKSRKRNDTIEHTSRSLYSKGSNVKSFSRHDSIEKIAGDNCIPKKISGVEVTPCAISSKDESSTSGKLKNNELNKTQSKYCDNLKMTKLRKLTNLSDKNPSSKVMTKDLNTKLLSASQDKEIINSCLSSVQSNKKDLDKKSKSKTETNIDLEHKIDSSQTEDIINPNSSCIKPSVAITPDYRLARDEITGQLFLLPASSNYQLSSLITNPSLSIQPVTKSLSSSNSLLSIANVDTSRNGVEQAIQACMSDEESADELVINETPESKNKVTSSCQVDMDAEVKDHDSPSIEGVKSIENEYKKIHKNAKERRRKDDDKLKNKNETKEVKEEKIEKNYEIFNESVIPTLPVQSEEVLNFINSRGLHLLVDSIEKLGEGLENKNEDNKNEDNKNEDNKNEDNKNDDNKNDDNKNDDNKNDDNKNDDKPESGMTFTDGLNLLSALAEQRALEEETKADNEKKSDDNVLDVSDSEKVSKKEKEERQEKQRSESCSSTFEVEKNTSLPRETVTRKKKKESISDPWLIRRSERIFLNEALNSNDTKLSQDKAVTKKKSRKSHNMINETDKESKSIKFNLEEKDLESNIRVIIEMDNLLYAGCLTPLEPPDVYGITLDGERTLNRHIYSREDVMRQAFKEIKPNSIDELREGDRVCAYWSSQYRCLYPGSVVRGDSPASSPERNLIFVDFDDGDKAKISLKDLRLLAPTFGIKDVNTDLKRKKSKVDKKEAEPKKDMQQNRKCKERHSANSDSNEDLSIKKQNESNEDNDEKIGKRKKLDKDKRKDKNKKFENDKKIHHKTKVQKKAKRLAKSESQCETEEEAEIWNWSDKGYKKYGSKTQSKKRYYREIFRGNEKIKIGDCAVFISTGRPQLPYVGRIDSMWETASGTMTVRVRWFYHPEETKYPPKLIDTKNALFESCHYDLNDIQTISHKCSVIPYDEFKQKLKDKSLSSSVAASKTYYFAGDYEPLSGMLQIAVGVPTGD